MKISATVVAKFPFLFPARRDSEWFNPDFGRHSLNQLLTRRACDFMSLPCLVFDKSD